MTFGLKAVNCSFSQARLLRSLVLHLGGGNGPARTSGVAGFPADAGGAASLLSFLNILQVWGECDLSSSFSKSVLLIEF